MGQARPDLIDVIRENPPGPDRGVILRRRYRGRVYERRVGPRGYVTQIEAAAILDVSLMTVNRYVRSGQLPDVKRDGISMIRLAYLLRFEHEKGRSR